MVLIGGREWSFGSESENEHQGCKIEIYFWNREGMVHVSSFIEVLRGVAGASLLGGAFGQ